MQTPKPDRRVQRTRHLLRQALLDLILERGYDAVSMQDITDRLISINEWVKIGQLPQLCTSKDYPCPYVYLAASLLGLIYVEPPEIVLKTIEMWCESQMEDRMIAIVMNTGLARLRQQAPEKVIEQIQIWLETNDLYYQQVGLRALISIWSTGEYENLPFFFHVLSPFVRNAPLKIRPDILEALQILASHSPKETAYFLGQNLKAPDNPDTAALTRKCLPHFPPEVQETLRASLRGNFVKH